MYKKPEVDITYKAENWLDFPQGDRLRCHACRGIYWRLWADVAQCMGCRSYTGLEINGPTGTLLDVEWINFALSESGSDGRVRDPISGKSEWSIRCDRIKARSSEQEMVIKPGIKGSWLMSAAMSKMRKIMNNKDAINIIKTSNALRNRNS